MPTSDGQQSVHVRERVRVPPTTGALSARAVWSMSCCCCCRSKRLLDCTTSCDSDRRRILRRMLAAGALEAGRDAQGS